MTLKKVHNESTELFKQSNPAPKWQPECHISIFHFYGTFFKFRAVEKQKIQLEMKGNRTIEGRLAPAKQEKSARINHDINIIEHGAIVF